jgi:hypothetical protein
MVEFRRRKDTGRVFPIKNNPTVQSVNNLMKQDKNRDIKEKIVEETRKVEIKDPERKAGNETIVVQEKEIDVEIDAKKK